MNECAGVFFFGGTTRSCEQREAALGIPEQTGVLLLCGAGVVSQKFGSSLLNVELENIQLGGVYVLLFDGRDDCLVFQVIYARDDCSSFLKPTVHVYAR